ncbi:MAG TPA: hypothetical protein VIV61_02730 [Candidatus Ozemobacteraceae bacterium]
MDTQPETRPRFFFSTSALWLSGAGGILGMMPDSPWLRFLWTRFFTDADRPAFLFGGEVLRNAGVFIALAGLAAERPRERAVAALFFAVIAVALFVPFHTD